MSTHRKKKRPKKPTGEIGMIRMAASPSGTTADFQHISFPNLKGEIEERIAWGFIKAARLQHVLPFRPMSVLPNNEDDFDFTMKTSAGKKTLELTEVAPLDQLAGSYEAATGTLRSYDFAQAVLSLVKTKSAHYGGAAPPGVHLLLYITHWAFLPGEAIRSLLQYWLLQTPHGFEGIYWFSPIDSETGEAILLFPTPFEHWRNFDPEAMRDSRVYNLDPRGWRSDGSQPIPFER